MSFNFIPVTLDNEHENQELPVIYELARDLDTMELIVREGKFYYVSKNEALKIWILKTLNRETARYAHRAYTHDYGNEITKLFGRHLKNSLLKSELERYIKEALLVNPYIKEVCNFTFEKNGSAVNMTFLVITVYGEFSQKITYEKE